MKFKIMSLIAALSLILMLAGCTTNSCVTVMSVEKNTSKTMKMSYSSFKGNKSRKIKFKKGEEVTFNVEVETKKGDLTVSILDPDEKEVYTVTNPKEKVSKNLKVEEDGKYQIKVHGDHKGSYEITWKVVGK